MTKLVSFFDFDAPDERPFYPEIAYEDANWETDNVIFQNAQWAVTTYGIENIKGPYHYHIESRSLRMSMGRDRTWVDHMAEKNWVDVDAFEQAYRKALEIFPGHS